MIFLIIYFYNLYLEINILLMLKDKSMLFNFLIKIAKIIIISCIIIYFFTYETIVIGKTKSNQANAPFKYDYATQKENEIENPNKSYSPDDFILSLSKKRLNTLFKVLQQKEQVYKDILNDFDQISFKNLNDFIKDEHYSKEISQYLLVENNEITATDSFIDHLKEISFNQTYIYSTQRFRSLQAQALNKFAVKPVIVTAAHSGYFAALEASILQVHAKFPGHPIIIYDLGLNALQKRKVRIF